MRKLLPRGSNNSLKNSYFRLKSSFVCLELSKKAFSQMLWPTWAWEPKSRVTNIHSISWVRCHNLGSTPWYVIWSKNQETKSFEINHVLKTTLSKNQVYSFLWALSHKPNKSLLTMLSSWSSQISCFLLSINGHLIVNPTIHFWNQYGIWPWKYEWHAPTRWFLSQL